MVFKALTQNETFRWIPRANLHGIKTDDEHKIKLHKNTKSAIMQILFLSHNKKYIYFFYIISIFSCRTYGKWCVMGLWHTYIFWLNASIFDEFQYD